MYICIYIYMYMYTYMCILVSICIPPAQKHTSRSEVATGSPLDGSNGEGNRPPFKSSQRCPTATGEACCRKEGNASRIPTPPTRTQAQSFATLDPSPELRPATGRHRDRLGKSVGVAAADKHECKDQIRFCGDWSSELCIFIFGLFFTAGAYPAHSLFDVFCGRHVE